MIELMLMVIGPFCIFSMEEIFAYVVLKAVGVSILIGFGYGIYWICTKLKPKSDAEGL